MNKQEFIKHLASKNESTQREMELVLNIVLEGIQSALETEDEIALLNFGRFYKKEIASRVGRNPSTGESMQIPAYMKVGLKAGKKLMETASKSLKPVKAKKKSKKK